ncbi:PAS domain S-box protein [Halobacteriales archaeon Cl-PHB]
MRDSNSSKAVPQQLCFEAVKHTADSVYITDTDGTIEYVNPAFEELTGFEEQEALGESPRILNSGEHDDAFYEELWQTITSGERWETKIVDETKGGEEVVFEQTISPITTDDGDVEKFVAIARDITERQRHERDLERFKQIQSRVLRHNLRNQLNIVQFHAEYFSRHLENEYAERAERVISVTNELETLTEKTRTIERLLDRKLEPRTLTLSEDLRALVETYRDQFPTVSFTLDCPADREIEAIPEITLVFENLIDNAARHNDAENPTVEIEVETDESVTTVRIRDNGPGIPEQEVLALERGCETSLNHGTGIGLWLVSWIVEKADATLAFETGSTGTEFWIRIPGRAQS